MGHGHCKACGVEGRSQKDFICDRCYDPQRNLVFCERCRHRFEATSAMLGMIEANSSNGIPPSGGMVIRASACSDCHEPGENIKHAIYTIPRRLRASA
ncbi:MAG: hypothetical protein RLZZ324_442 [Candidatus Parcubacteria bacterium]|jgi:hypothetical protein